MEYGHYWIYLSILSIINPSSLANTSYGATSAADLKCCFIVLAQHHDRNIAIQASTILTNNFGSHPVIISSDHFTDNENRAIAPIFPKLYEEYGTECIWFVLVTPDTHIVDAGQADLIHMLLQYTEPMSQAYFLGHSLHDTQPSIIHHFLHNVNSIHYPLMCSGVVLSNMAVQRIVQYFSDFVPDFTIDPSHEFALFLKYLRFPSTSELFSSPLPQHEHGFLLEHVQSLCSSEPSTTDNTSCVLYCQTTKQYCNKQGHHYHSAPTVSNDDVVFGVKTHQANHNTRLPVMWNTWTGGNPSPLNIRFFSDITDAEYNTVETGVANTVRGHCSKLLSILHQMNSLYSKRYSWLVICDDDTLLSIPRLFNFLSCYDHNDPLIIGELYGYHVYKEGFGYLYPTGGSGIVFSRAAVEGVVNSGIVCPTDDYPDDMFIGMIASMRLRIQQVHSPLFHQDQPLSYHPLLLKTLAPPISFHRHAPRDPIEIYKTYLKDQNTEETTYGTTAKLEL